MQSKLYRSRTDRILGGVCGGLGAYLGVDTILIRVFFILLGMTGSGVLIYILLWILIRDESRASSETGEPERFDADEFTNRARAVGDDIRVAVNQPNPRATLFIGAALVILGLMYLVQNLHIPWLQWIKSEIFWPLLLIVGGIVLLQRALRKR